MAIISDTEVPETGGLLAPPERVTLQTRLQGIGAHTFSSLSNRDYKLFYQGNFVTQTGFWMQQVAFGWLVLELSNNAFYLGLVGFFRALPVLLLSPFGGVLADRLDRKKLILWTQASSMIIAVVLSLLVITHSVRLWHLFVSSLLSGAVLAINNPTRQALVPQLVKRAQLSNAIALNSMSLNTSRIIGPALAGALIGLIGIGGCLLLQAVGYIWALFNVGMITVPPSTGTRTAGSVRQNLKEGFSYCYRTQALFLLLMIATVPMVFAMPYSQLLPVFARSVFDIGAGGLGILLSTMGAGALLGSFGLAACGDRVSKGVIMLGSLISFGVLLCLFAAIHVFPLALLCLAGVGACSSVYSTINSTMIQEIVPDHLRGRVMSIYMITFGLMPLGTLPGGKIAQVWGAPTAVFGGGAVCALFGLIICITQPTLRGVPRATS